MGWSHGGYITLLSVFRDRTPFKAAAAMVPVTNLVFRLSYKGPAYQQAFATQERIQALPFEKPDLYIERSPLYHVDKLRIPLLVHVATNDTDVNYVEDQQIVDALRSRKPDLAETRVYVDPTPGPASVGHTFNRRTNLKTLERDDSPEQRDSVEPCLDILRVALAALRRASAAAGLGGALNGTCRVTSSSPAAFPSRPSRDSSSSSSARGVRRWSCRRRRP